MSRTKYDLEDLKSMTKDELKAELKSHDLPVSGNKDKLISRLKMFNMTNKQLKEKLKKQNLPVSGNKQQLVRRLVTGERSKTASPKKSKKSSSKSKSKRRSKSPVRCTIGKDNKEYYFNPKSGKRVKDKLADKRGSEPCVLSTERKNISYSDQTPMDRVRSFVSLKQVSSDLERLEDNLTRDQTYLELVARLEGVIRNLEKALKDVNLELRDEIKEIHDNMEKVQNVLKQQNPNEVAEPEVRELISDISSTSADRFTEEPYSSLSSDVLEDALRKSGVPESTKESVRRSLLKDVVDEEEYRDLDALISSMEDFDMVDARRKEIKEKDRLDALLSERDLLERQSTEEDERKLSLPTDRALRPQRRMKPSLEALVSGEIKRPSDQDMKKSTQSLRAKTKSSNNLLSKKTKRKVTEIEDIVPTSSPKTQINLYLGRYVSDPDTGDDLFYLSKDLKQSIMYPLLDNPGKFIYLNDQSIIDIYKKENVDPLENKKYIVGIPAEFSEVDTLGELNDAMVIVVPEILEYEPEELLDIPTGINRFYLANYYPETENLVPDYEKYIDAYLGRYTNSVELYEDMDASPYQGQYVIYQDKDVDVDHIMRYRTKAQQEYYDLTGYEETRQEIFDYEA